MHIFLLAMLVKNRFSNILIPVDLSISTDVAVKKGVDLSGDGTVIHLLYVESIPISTVSPAAYKYVLTPHELNHQAAEERLMQWKHAIEEVGNVLVKTHTVHGSIQHAIEDMAVKLKADLIIIGKKSHHSWFPFLNTVIPSRVARTTNVPVLTVKPGALYSEIKKVVVPISVSSLNEKEELLIALSKKFRIRIYLVAFTGEDDFNVCAQSLLQLYQRLKTSTACPVDYYVLQGKNKAKAVLDYAERINADILLVEPETETRIGWLNKHISDVLSPRSKMQVLAV